jgi:hypothetical protein
MDLVIGCNRFVDGADDDWAARVERRTGVKSVTYQTAFAQYHLKTKSRVGFNDQVIYDYDRCFIHLRNTKGHCNREHYAVIKRFVDAGRDVYVIYEDKVGTWLHVFKSIEVCPVPKIAMWAIVKYGVVRNWRDIKPAGPR